MFGIRSTVVAVAMLAISSLALAQEKNLTENPSFEEAGAKEPKAPVFPKWIFKVWEGQCDLRVIEYSWLASASLIEPLFQVIA